MVLAVRWLELNEPDVAISLPEVVNKAQRLAADPEVKPQPTNSESKLGNTNASKKREQNDGDNVTVVSQPERGNSDGYLIRRLKRDRPDLAAKLADGTIKSARAAALEAGIVKPVVQLSRDPQKAAQQIATYSLLQLGGSFLEDGGGPIDGRRTDVHEFGGLSAGDG